MIQALIGHGWFHAVETPVANTETYFEVSAIIPCHTTEGEGSVQLDVEFAALADWSANVSTHDINLEVSLDFIQKLYGVGFSWEGVDETQNLAGAAGAELWTEPIAKDGQNLHTVIMLPMHDNAGTWICPSAAVGIKGLTGRWTLSDGTADVFNTTYAHSRSRMKMNAHMDINEIDNKIITAAHLSNLSYPMVQKGLVFEQFASIPANKTNRLTVQIDDDEDVAWEEVHVVYGFKMDRA